MLIYKLLLSCKAEDVTNFQDWTDKGSLKTGGYNLILEEEFSGTKTNKICPESLLAVEQH